MRKNTKKTEFRLLMDGKNIQACYAETYIAGDAQLGWNSEFCMGFSNALQAAAPYFYFSCNLSRVLQLNMQLLHTAGTSSMAIPYTAMCYRKHTRKGN